MNLICPAERYKYVWTDIRKSEQSWRNLNTWQPYQRHVLSVCSTYWNNSPGNFVYRFKSTVFVTQSKIWFKDIILSRSFIIKFNLLHTGHHLLPSHAYKLNLWDSLNCTLHLIESFCSSFHILFNHPSLSIFLILFNSLKCPF